MAAAALAEDWREDRGADSGGDSGCSAFEKSSNFIAKIRETVECD